MPEKRLAVAVEVARVVEFLHSFGFCHQRLSPAAVVVQEANQRLSIKLLGVDLVPLDPHCKGFFLSIDESIVYGTRALQRPKPR